MGIWEKAKASAKTTKLQADILLLDREVTARKQKFGVELSDLLWDMDAKTTVGSRGSATTSGVLSQLRTEWEVAKADLTAIHQRKNEIQAKLNESSPATAAATSLLAGQLNKAGGDKGHQQQQAATTTNNGSFMDKAKAAGTEGKRRAKLQLIERELKARKQQYGIDVYDKAVSVVLRNNQTANGGGATLTDTKNQGAQSVTNAIDKNQKLGFLEKQLAKAVIGKVSAGLNQLTVSDQDVIKCITTAQAEIEAIQQKKQAKQTEIEQLKQQQS